jgi:hypothetical protein
MNYVTLQAVGVEGSRFLQSIWGDFTVLLVSLAVVWLNVACLVTVNDHHLIIIYLPLTYTRSQLVFTLFFHYHFPLPSSSKVQGQVSVTNNKNKNNSKKKNWIKNRKSSIDH